MLLPVALALVRLVGASASYSQHWATLGGQQADGWLRTTAEELEVRLNGSVSHAARASVIGGPSAATVRRAVWGSIGFSVFEVDVVVVHLKQDVARLQRIQHLIRRSRLLNALRPAIFDAIDGGALELASLERAGVLAPGGAALALDAERFVEGHALTPGAVGCALSHLALWRACAARDRPMLVLEDDIVLSPDADERLAAVLSKPPPAYGLLFLGSHAFTREDGASAPVAPPLTGWRRAWGSAYGLFGVLVSPPAARYLLQLALPLTAQIDSMLLLAVAESLMVELGLIVALCRASAQLRASPFALAARSGLPNAPSLPARLSHLANHVEQGLPCGALRRAVARDGRSLPHPAVPFLGSFSIADGRGALAAAASQPPLWSLFAPPAALQGAARSVREDARSFLEAGFIPHGAEEAVAAPACLQPALAPISRADARDGALRSVGHALWALFAPEGRQLLQAGRVFVLDRPIVETDKSRERHTRVQQMGRALTALV